MAKQAISVTLDADNITWLKARLGPSGARSVSELLDQLVTAARLDGRAGAPRSVVATIDIDASDPSLERTDAAVRKLFQASLRRPIAARERRPVYATRAVKRRRG